MRISATVTGGPAPVEPLDDGNDQHVSGGSLRGGRVAQDRLQNCPVKLEGVAATSSGVPLAMILPPPSPPSGPRSTTQSAVLMTSRLCSSRPRCCRGSRRRCSTFTSRSMSGVQSRRRLVQDEEGAAGIALGQLEGELHALRLARKVSWRSAELDVAEADLQQGRELARDGRPPTEKNSWAASTVIASTSWMGRPCRGSPASRGYSACRGRRSQERRRRAGSASTLMRPSPWHASQRPPFTLKEKRPGRSRGARDSGPRRRRDSRIGVKSPCTSPGSSAACARSGSGRRYHLVEEIETLDGVVGRGLGGRAVQMVRDRRIERVVDEGRLARARAAGDRDEEADREVDRHVLEIVAARAGDAQHALVRGLAAARRDGDRLAAEYIGP